MLLSTAIIMEGFDTALLASLFALPAFQQKFGERQPDGSYQLTAAWQAGLSNAALVGEILGLFANGILAERVGYRRTMMGALALVGVFVLVIFFAETLPQLLVGEMLVGIPWGVFQTLTTTYAADVCPVRLRAYLTTYVNLCWVLGQLLAAGVLRAMVARGDELGRLAYRIPFALQWVWPVPLMVGIYLAPESPWWLVRKGRIDEARHALSRLTSSGGGDFNADETVAMMVRTNEMERAAAAGTSYRDLVFGGAMTRRRTEIVCAVWAIQTLCGSSLMGYSAYFYAQAGMAADRAFTMTLAQYAMGAGGTLGSWFLMEWFGRRTLYLAGQAAMSVVLLAIGLVAALTSGGRDSVSAQWAIGSMLLVYTLAYDSTVGPVCYSLVAELPSTRLRTKTVVLARNLYNVVGIAANVVTPNMLNPTAWNWGARSAFFWAALCFLCAIWTFFRLPEPKGRTYGELDALFEQRVPARRFKQAVIETPSGGDGDGKEVAKEGLSEEA